MTAPVTASFDLEAYLAASTENIIKSMVKAAVFHPRESRFMAQFALAAKKAAALRQQAAEQGHHVPPFLIASITQRCNLHCVGCFARALETHGTDTDQLSATEWERIFREARDMGVSFLFLVGGEPLVRKDVIEKAAQFPEILFPVITNGTMLTGKYLALFDQHRNLLPVLSIEGDRHQTDARRGSGIYETLQTTMEQLQKRHIAFGASVTVTAENLSTVTDTPFLQQLQNAGCKAVLYVEFVPTSSSLQSLTLDDTGRAQLADRLAEIRRQDQSMLLLSFPGDEKSSGGCLAAGRGFFHINAHGGAEPCPFSPYADSNVRNRSLREAMDSPLFRNLQEQGFLTEDHDGGCVLYQKQQQVAALLGTPNHNTNRRKE